MVAEERIRRNHPFLQIEVQVQIGDPKPPVPNTAPIRGRSEKIGPNPGLDLFKDVPSGS
jgi:hypothetical protein